MIKLDSKTNLSLLEEYYLKIQKKSPTDIQISKFSTGIGFGLVPAMIQFISTWHNVMSEGKIVLNVNLESYDLNDAQKIQELGDKYLSQFYKLDFFFTIVTYCWSRQIVDKKGLDLKPLLKIQNISTHERMQKQIGGGGNKYILSCFDHLSSKKGLLKAFYISDDFINNELTFDYAIDSSLKQVLSLNHNLRKFNYSPVHQDIVSIIYELMKNTHDWARTDIHNKPFKVNSRGLFMKLHRQKRDVYEREFEDHAGLKDYFSEKNFTSTNSDELYFLELSVFDTGIGYVHRYSGIPANNFNPIQQVEIIKQCLIVNNTSSTGLEKNSKGKGLDRIMNILNKKGLFWIRTGNVSVFRNLVIRHYLEKTDIEKIELFDWFSNSTTNISNLSEVRGSVFTLVYPITNLSNA